MIKNVIRVLIANIVVMLTSFINTLIIPKLLSINGYAEYQTFMLYVSYIGLMTFGFHSGLFIKYGGKDRNTVEKKQFKSEMNLVLISQILVTIIVIIVAYKLKNFLLFCTAICIITSNFVSVYKYLYQAWNEFKTFSIINIIQSLGFSGFVLVFGLFQGQLNEREIIYIYIIINAVCFLGIGLSYFKMTRGIKSNPILSTENRRIFEMGFLLMLGGAANVVFSSVDKYFIKGIFTNYEFSMYSFAITLLNVMNIFISAIAQPMYLQLMQNLDDHEARKRYKEMLFSFGALSGCAYYVVAIIVKYFLPEYMDSLKVVGILFAIFPAVAIINCLYINLYKATNQIKRYLWVLAVMIGTSVTLNAVAVWLNKKLLSIAVAATVCYYIWLLISSKDFQGLKITKKDGLFLIGFFLIYFVFTNITNAIVGFFAYLVIILIWVFVIYRDCVMKAGTLILSRMKGIIK